MKTRLTSRATAKQTTGLGQSSAGALKPHRYQTHGGCWLIAKVELVDRSRYSSGVHEGIRLPRQNATDV